MICGKAVVQQQRGTIDWRRVPDSPTTSPASPTPGMTKMLRLITSVAVAMLLLFQPAQAQRDRDGDWELLGQKRVGFDVDRDVIDIGQSEEWFRNRAYRALRFEAERSDVHMIAVRLVYLNGHAEDLRIDRQIRAGGRLPLDLRGERSYLKQIEMTYRARPGFSGQAFIKVYGEPVRRRPDRPVAEEGRRDEREVLLGEQRVGFRVDRDTINIGQSEDWFRNRSFRSLRFHADGNDVHMMAIRLVYLNGHTEDLRVDRRIQAGRDMRVELRGDRSYLRQIEMTYRSRPNFEGQAVVKVYGEPTRRRDRG
jgi:hypothetical protein